MADSKVKKVGNVASKTLKKTGGTIVNKGTIAIDKVRDIKDNISFEDTLTKAMKIPGVKIDRETFLRKELRGRFPENVIDLAVEHNPAYAGIKRSTINTIAKSVIKFESTKVSLVSAAAGAPGGAAMIATVPADMVQYYGFVLRIIQKLAYLYGFEEFEFTEEAFSDETLNEIIVFTGVMFGVKGANTALKTLVGTASKKLSKSVAQKALTKGTIYPIVKKTARRLGFRMNKQIFADGLSHMVPLFGAVASGGITYASFRPSSNRLRKKLAELNLSDPDFYRGKKIEDIDDVLI